MVLSVGVYTAVIAIILLIRPLLFGRGRRLEPLNIAMSTVGLYLAAISISSLLFDFPNFTSGLPIKLLIILPGIFLFISPIFYPYLTGQIVHKRLGKPCKITDYRVQLYLSRDDLPLQDIVNLARKEIVFVSVTHELTATDDRDVIRNAIRLRNIRVKILILNPNADLSYQEQVFGLKLERRIKDSKEQLCRFKNDLGEHGDKLTIRTYSTPNFPYSLVIVDPEDYIAFMKIEEHPPESRPYSRPNKAVFKKDFESYYDDFYKIYQSLSVDTADPCIRKLDPLVFPDT